MLRYFALMSLALAALADDAHPTLKIGSQAPDFSLIGIDGKMHSLGEYSSSRALVIVFTCNHCPVAQMYERRIKKLADDYQNKGVALVAINPNNPAGVQLDELRFSDVGDSLDDCKNRAAFRHFNFPYLYDGDDQAVAQAYGPVATPHVFVFDEQRKLRYEGRVDDNMRESLATTHDARDAIDAVLAGKPAPIEHTGVFGCSIKWKAKEGLRLTQLQRMDSEPVDIAWRFETPEALRKLHKNPTSELLLVTFWDPSVPQSVEQLSNIVTIYRTYRRRDLEVVTVALNHTDDKHNPEEVLHKEHASMKNMQIAFANRSAAEAAFDAKWDGTLPFTVVISPDGKVLYRQQGQADDLQLRRLLLANLPGLTAGPHGEVFDYEGAIEYWQGK
jgi:peroxiredoxin